MSPTENIVYNVNNQPNNQQNISQAAASAVMATPTAVANTKTTIVEVEVDENEKSIYKQ